MSKQKTRKSALARFKVTKSGKLLHRSQQLRHLRSQKNKRRIRSLKRMKQVVGKFKSKLERMLGRK
ncbi:50S ribosomal protein L35 [Candidatus Roizmanbacteria bacterium]|nr:50S ribosomal protein L35 [Candidatus Roizmanbacteria bacterium]